MNILVTGGSKGLGESIVKSLSQSDNKVYYTYNRTFKEQAYNQFPLKVDFNNCTSKNDFLKSLGKLEIDVLVNNYYNSPQIKHAHKLSEEDILKGMVNNIIPTIELTNLIVTDFRKRKRGLIINILTNYLNGDFPLGLTGYVSEKAFLESFLCGINNENKKFGIKLINKYPKFMNTSFSNLNIEMRDAIINSGNFTNISELSNEIMHDILKYSNFQPGL